MTQLKGKRREERRNIADMPKLSPLLLRNIERFGFLSRFSDHASRKTLTNHAAYLSYNDNFTSKQRTKKIISEMKFKLNADTFCCLKSLFFLDFSFDIFYFQRKKGPFLSPFSKLICIK